MELEQSGLVKVSGKFMLIDGYSPFVVLYIAAVPHPGLQGELVVLVEQMMNSKSGVLQVV